MPPHAVQDDLDHQPSRLRMTKPPSKLQVAGAIYNWVLWLLLVFLVLTQSLSIFWNSSTWTSTLYFGRDPLDGPYPILSSNDESYSDRSFMCVLQGRSYVPLTVNDALASGDTAGTAVNGYRVVKRDSAVILPQALDTYTTMCSIFAVAMDEVLKVCVQLGYNVTHDDLRLIDDLNSNTMYQIQNSLPIIIMPFWDNSEAARSGIPGDNGSACMFRLDKVSDTSLLFLQLTRCFVYRALVYTHTKTLLSLPKEFTKLEYLHIEGTLGISSLESSPDDMFADTDSLTFLHFAIHPNLRRLPSLDGLVNLRSLTLAILLQLEELPDFRSLADLERLLLAIAPKLDAFPDMAHMKSLSEFVLSYRSRVCCNGFLGNKCDLNKPICSILYWWGEAPVTCLPTNRTDKIATDATHNTFTRFPYSTCFDVTEDPTTQDDIPTKEDMLKCNGTMYRRCEKQPCNRTGICYNPRMMLASCDGSSLPIAMRKRQIVEKVGDPYDPEYEAWVGCVGS